MNINEGRAEARAHRIILAAVARDRDAIDNVLNEACQHCLRELALCGVTAGAECRFYPSAARKPKWTVANPVLSEM